MIPSISRVLASSILIAAIPAGAGGPGLTVPGEHQKEPGLVTDVLNGLTFRKPGDWHARTPSSDGAEGITVLINYPPMDKGHGTPPANHVKVELRVASRGKLTLADWTRQRQEALRQPGFIPDPARTGDAVPYRLAGRQGLAYASWGPGRMPALNFDLDWGGRVLVATLGPTDSPALADALAVLDTVRDAAQPGVVPSLSVARGHELARALNPALQAIARSPQPAVTAEKPVDGPSLQVLCNGPAGTFDWGEAPSAQFTLQMPFPSGSSWEVGGIGSYFGNGCHINSNNDYYATDWNRRSTNCASGYLEDDGFEVRPVANGTVKQSDCNDTTGYGCQVVIEHTNAQGTFRTRYAHLQQTSINTQLVGQWVTTATTIGRVGCSGLQSCGPHLHLSLQQWIGSAFRSTCSGPASSTNCPNGLPKASYQTIKPSPIQTSSGSVPLTDGYCYISANGGTPPWTQTVDDSSSSCNLYGPPQYWYAVSGYGINNQMHYTWNAQSSGSNYVYWTIQVPQTGNYRFEVYIPSNHATTTSARYYIWNGSVWLGPYIVNQNSYYNAWVTLGTVSLPAGVGTVYLGDVTGEATSTRKVGVDAVRATRQ